MITKKELKQKLRAEFDAIIPNVYNKISKKKVIPSPLGFEVNIKQKLVINFSRLAIAASLIIGLLSYGGYSYYTPNTIMSINVNPTILNTLLKLSGLETTAEVVESVNITVAVNDYERVVDVSADTDMYHQALIELKLTNQNYQVALQKVFVLLNEHGSIDIIKNSGRVTFMILDDNQSRIDKFTKYIIQNLPNDVGVKNQRMIQTETIEFDTSTNNLTGKVHPAKAMAIKEIMLQTNQYSFEQLAAMDKMQLLHIMMELKRNKR